jgi:hypothetical protein
MKDPFLWKEKSTMKRVMTKSMTKKVRAKKNSNMEMKKLKATMMKMDRKLKVANNTMETSKRKAKNSEINSFLNILLILICIYIYLA